MKHVKNESPRNQLIHLKKTEMQRWKRLYANKMLYAMFQFSKNRYKTHVINDAWRGGFKPITFFYSLFFIITRIRYRR
jgi:hypothetical protein